MAHALALSAAALLGCSSASPGTSDPAAPADTEVADAAEPPADTPPTVDTPPTPEDTPPTPDGNAPYDAPPPPPDDGPEVAEDVADSADTPPPPFEYAWEPDGTCGMAPYSWLPPDEVGALLEFSEDLLLNLSPELIGQMLGELGYPDIVTPQWGTRAFRIRYTTQDKGQLVEATAMVGLPDVGPLGDALQQFPTTLFLHPTVGYADSCAPSSGIVGSAGAVLPATLGYVSVAPDFIGMCGFGEPCEEIHPYLIGEPTALASWDAVRATYQLLEELQADLALQPDPRVVPWGASQGGHAALFVDRYAAVYAPEFEVPCAVAMVPPGNLAGQALHALSKLSAATELGTAFMAAALLWYDPPGGASGLFNSDGETDFAQHIVAAYPTTCNAGDLIKGATQVEDIYDPTFVQALLSGDLAAIEPWGCIALANSVPTADVPYLGATQTLIILGEADKLVHHGVEVLTFEQLCAQGHHLQLVDCAGGTHTQTALDTLKLQIDWVASCVEGEKIPAELDCVVTPPAPCAL